MTRFRYSLMRHIRHSRRRRHARCLALRNVCLEKLRGQHPRVILLEHNFLFPDLRTSRCGSGRRPRVLLHNSDCERVRSVPQMGSEIDCDPKNLETHASDVKSRRRSWAHTDTYHFQRAPALDSPQTPLGTSFASRTSLTGFVDSFLIVAFNAVHLQAVCVAQRRCATDPTLDARFLCRRSRSIQLSRVLFASRRRPECVPDESIVFSRIKNCPEFAPSRPHGALILPLMSLSVCSVYDL